MLPDYIIQQCDILFLAFGVVPWGIVAGISGGIYISLTLSARLTFAFNFESFTCVFSIYIKFNMLHFAKSKGLGGSSVIMQTHWQE